MESCNDKFSKKEWGIPIIWVKFSESIALQKSASFEVNRVEYTSRIEFMWLMFFVSVEIV